jgi:hypothetical protein
MMGLFERGKHNPNDHRSYFRNVPMEGLDHEMCENDLNAVDYSES